MQINESTDPFISKKAKSSRKQVYFEFQPNEVNTTLDAYFALIPDHPQGVLTL